VVRQMVEKRDETNDSLIHPVPIKNDQVTIGLPIECIVPAQDGYLRHNHRRPRWRDTQSNVVAGSIKIGAKSKVRAPLMSKKIECYFCDATKDDVVQNPLGKDLDLTAVFLEFSALLKKQSPFGSRSLRWHFGMKCGDSTVKIT